MIFGDKPKFSYFEKFKISYFCVVKVDEWGAVIRNQNEAFRRMEENKTIEK